MCRKPEMPFLSSVQFIVRVPWSARSLLPLLDGCPLFPWVSVSSSFVIISWIFFRVVLSVVVFSVKSCSCVTFVELLVCRVVHSFNMCIWVSWDWPQALHSRLLLSRKPGKIGKHGGNRKTQFKICGNWKSLFGSCGKPEKPQNTMKSCKNWKIRKKKPWKAGKSRYFMRKPGNRPPITLA